MSIPSTSSTDDNDNILLTLSNEFSELVVDRVALRGGVECFLHDTITDIINGIIFELHRQHKIGAFDLHEDSGTVDQTTQMAIMEEFRAYGEQPLPYTSCSICDRKVDPTKFAPHLANCLGMGRKSSRPATRLVASRATNDQMLMTYGGGGGGVTNSDDEDDADWSTDNRRGKKKKRNGNKRFKGVTTRKSLLRSKSSPSPEADASSSYEELLNLNELLLEHSNSPTSTDDTSGNVGSPKKRERTRAKRLRKDRSSTNSSASNV